MLAPTARAMKTYMAASTPIHEAATPDAREPSGMTPHTAKRKIAFMRPSMWGGQIS